MLLLQVEVDEDTLSAEEAKERRIMKLLLKIKNGTPPMRKVCESYLFVVGPVQLLQILLL